MLIQLEDVARHSSNSKQRYVGIVVDNEDPDKLGRIKVKVPNMIESGKKERLPWIYPYRDAGTGGNPGNSTHQVPEKHSQVYVTFPNDDPYSAFYESAPLNKGTSQSPSHNNPVPEAPQSELKNEVDPSKSDQSNITTNAWRTTRGHPNWIRIDRNQGKVELYMGEAGLYFHFDRGGNVQLKTPGNLDFDIGGKITFKSGKDFTMKVGEQYTIDVGKDATFKTAKKFMVDVGSDASMKVSGNRGATIKGDDDTAVTGSRRAVVSQTDAVKAMKSYQQIQTTVTVSAGSTYNLKAGGVANISASSLIQLGASTILKNSGGGAQSATSAAVAAMQAYFVSSAATGSMSATAMPSGTETPIGQLFPTGTDLSKPLSQQTPAIQTEISSMMQSNLFNGGATTQLFSSPLSTVMGSQPLSQFTQVTNIQNFVQTLPSLAVQNYLAPSIMNGMNPSQIFSGDVKGLLTQLNPSQMLGLTDMSSLFGSLDPNTLVNSLGSQLTNGFSLGGRNFDFIGRKIISEFMNKFAIHLTSLATLTGRVQLMTSKLNALDGQGNPLQSSSKEFENKMEQRASKLVGEDL